MFCVYQMKSHTHVHVHVQCVLYIYSVPNESYYISGVVIKHTSCCINWAKYMYSVHWHLNVYLHVSVLGMCDTTKK